ncbi:MAG TPA: hypothetical protein VGV59_17895 [Pyrinomonadaceae bacterium]|nr:hypothetical protein [Pyrinomonadaceae bacterium]
MTHPFESVPRAVRRRIFLPLLAAALLVLVTWVLTVSPMSNEKAPLSVSSFGMAWDIARAREMMASWDDTCGRKRESSSELMSSVWLKVVTWSLGMARPMSSSTS